MASGIATGMMSGMATGLTSGIASSLPSGIETPDTMLNLRKASESEQPKQLYQVCVWGGEMAVAGDSTRIYRLHCVPNLFRYTRERGR